MGEIVAPELASPKSAKTLPGGVEATSGADREAGFAAAKNARIRTTAATEFPATGASYAKIKQRISRISQSVGKRYQLSTTGYQSAMARLNRPDKLDGQSTMTLERAQQYQYAAKQTFPDETLKSLGKLQKEHINTTPTGELKGGVELSPEHLSEYVEKCRNRGFANCDMQALETGLHIRHELGLPVSIFSNKATRHNYVVIGASETFPKGAIVDPWTGKGLQELNVGTKIRYKHFEANIRPNKSINEWIEKFGADHLEASK